MLDLDPAPWREIELPLATTLAGLHSAIQAAFLWQDAHLWQFELDGRTYGPEADSSMDFRTYKAAGLRLARLHETRITDFLCVYDMGDDWQHRVQILETRGCDASLPRFLDGRWRRPPEDVGGPPGFEAFLEAVADPEHPEHGDLLDWHGGPFDPADIGIREIGRRMAALAAKGGRKR